MPFFLTQWTYKDTEIRGMVMRPQNREDVVRLAVEGLGGQLHAFYFCFGEYDGMCITEFEDKETALACLMVVIGQGAAGSIKTTPLFAEQEIRTAMDKAHDIIARPQDDRPQYGPPSQVGELIDATRGQRAKPERAVEAAVQPEGIDGGLLGDVATLEVRKDSSTAEQRGGPPRWINAEIEDHDPAAPLAPSETYTIAFGVDVARRGVASTVLNQAALFPPGVEQVELTVQLNSEDFDISDATQLLRIGRTGKSRRKARFEITPRREGRCTLRATFHVQGNFVQHMEISISVGSVGAMPVETVNTGRPVAAAAVVRPRDLLLIMKPAAAGGYDFTAAGTGFKSVRLPVEPTQLTSAIAAVRDALLEVVQQLDGSGAPVFQTRIDIGEAERASVLRTMARAGARLFQVLFTHPGAGSDVAGIGTWLRTVATAATGPLTIQVVAQSAPVPWPMLYLAEVSANAKLDWDHFLGMRHVIEQLPMQNELSYGDAAIVSDRPTLQVSLNVNSKIDVQMRADYVAQQQRFWATARAARRRLEVTPRTTRDEIVAALAGAGTPDQIFYFYGHAVAAGLGTPGGIDASSLVLSDARLTLGDLNLDAPTNVRLVGNPLIFINACESAQMSPLFYDGFVPYFMAKGARGVIGTECKTPALFAAAWATRFFERFLDGEPLGTLVLGLRREFLERHGNPLGLLYAVHCDGDTQVAPALLANP